MASDMMAFAQEGSIDGTWNHRARYTRLDIVSELLQPGANADIESTVPTLGRTAEIFAEEPGNRAAFALLSEVRSARFVGDRIIR